MLQNSRNVVLVHSQTINANGNTGMIPVPEGYNAVNLVLVTGTTSGTSPTLDVYIQQGFKDVTASDTTDGVDMTATTFTIWDDYAHFAQATGSGKQVMRILGGPGTSATNTPTASVAAIQDAALAVSTIKVGNIGTAWRVKWVVGGTSPSFAATYLIAQFIPN